MNPSDYYLERNKKRKRDTDEPENEYETKPKRQEVTLAEFNPREQNISDQLIQLGQNIALVAENQPTLNDTEEAIFSKIQNDFNVILRDAFVKANTAIVTRERNREQVEAVAMEQEELSQATNVKEQFFQNLRGITDRMSQELTIGQQARMFKHITETMNHVLTENSANQDAEQINQTTRIAEIASILYNYSLTQLAVTFTNIYDSTPKKIEQLVSIITASGMAYNYLPTESRVIFENITYFGPLFTLLNRVNPQALLIQNAAATVTTTYYLLKNAGVDTDAAIDGLKEFTKTTATICARDTGKFVCSSASSALTSLQQGATSLLHSITNKLGDILTYEYSVANLMTSSQTSDSSISISSVRTVNTSSPQNSEKIQNSIKSVESLLTTSIDNGGILLAGTLTPPEIIEERFTIINNLTNEGQSPESLDNGSSQISDISDISDDSVTYGTWTFPPRNASGGRKTRHRNRNRRSIRRSIKGKNYKKRRATHKKHRKHNKTIKHRRKRSL